MTAQAELKDLILYEKTKSWKRDVDDGSVVRFCAQDSAQDIKGQSCKGHVRLLAPPTGWLVYVTAPLPPPPPQTASAHFSGEMFYITAAQLFMNENETLLTLR